MCFSAFIMLIEIKTIILIIIAQYFEVSLKNILQFQLHTRKNNAILKSSDFYANSFFNLFNGKHIIMNPCQPKGKSKHVAVCVL